MQINLEQFSIILKDLVDKTCIQTSFLIQIKLIIVTKNYFIKIQIIFLNQIACNTILHAILST